MASGQFAAAARVGIRSTGRHTMTAKLREKYRKEIVPQMMKEMGLAHAMQAPALVKIVVNMGIGIADKNAFEARLKDLAAITGQRPVVTKARKSISNFKVREGMNLGAKITLRGARMYEFLDRLINAALPRIRDFRGLSPRSFDGRGNYSIGLRDVDIFPEIDPNRVAGGGQGMDVVIVTSANSDDVARNLLKLFGMPFSKN